MCFFLPLWIFDARNLATRHNRDHSQVVCSGEGGYVQVSPETRHYCPRVSAAHNFSHLFPSISRFFFFLLLPLPLDHSMPGIASGSTGTPRELLPTTNWRPATCRPPALFFLAFPPPNPALHSSHPLLAFPYLLCTCSPPATPPHTPNHPTPNFYTSPPPTLLLSSSPPPLPSPHALLAMQVAMR
jgi:hypothetical protein